MAATVLAMATNIITFCCGKKDCVQDISPQHCLQSGQQLPRIRFATCTLRIIFCHYEGAHCVPRTKKPCGQRATRRIAVVVKVVMTVVVEVVVVTVVVVVAVVVMPVAAMAAVVVLTIAIVSLPK